MKASKLNEAQLALKQPKPDTKVEEVRGTEGTGETTFGAGISDTR